MTNARMLGNNSGGAAAPSEMTQANVLSFLGVEAGATADQTQSDINGLAITTVGTIDTGTWEGTTIAVDQGGTGATSLNNLITLTTHTTGNYVATLTAGALIDLQNNTGEGATPTIDVDLTEAGEAAIANGDYILFLDGGATGTHAKEAVADLATLFAGTSLTASNSVISVDDDFIKNDADDTMAGTLTIDKNSTQIGGQTEYGISIDYDHTGITAESQTLSNIGLAVDVNNSTITHVGTHKNYGIANSVRSNTTGTSEVYGIHNYASVGDTVYGIYNKMLAAGTTGYGIYQEVDDGDTDYIQVSSANTADYFKMSTTANGATTLETVDADAALAHMVLDAAGDITFDA